LLGGVGNEMRMANVQRVLQQHPRINVVDVPARLI
jgi:hypothetical protein